MSQFELPWFHCDQSFNTTQSSLNFFLQIQPHSNCHEFDSIWQRFVKIGEIFPGISPWILDWVWISFWGLIMLNWPLGRKFVQEVSFSQPSFPQTGWLQDFCWFDCINQNLGPSYLWRHSNIINSTLDCSCMSCANVSVMSDSNDIGPLCVHALYCCCWCHNHWTGGDCPNCNIQLFHLAAELKQLAYWIFSSF